eukprot:5558252-Amphidinium_carterae.1
MAGFLVTTCGYLNTPWGGGSSGSGSNSEGASDSLREQTLREDASPGQKLPSYSKPKNLDPAPANAVSERTVAVQGKRLKSN